MFLLNRQCALACLEDVSKFLTRGGQVAVSITINYYLWTFLYNIKLFKMVYECYAITLHKR